jgi:hypothetical protein
MDPMAHRRDRVDTSMLSSGDREFACAASNAVLSNLSNEPQLIR